ncbi:Cysteine-rich secretory protein family protein [Micromonospora sp. MW-13]|uniref:CAP domain-containing protein n=1 Tax=Micromonospora sp. MW-13 TaxID=2094022 RepID=UPI000E43DF3A|nr:CAP domain-containing protein [Micromonospora sp. MW-13]RGC69966.1 Cysteine-rich secretory protein family protein [Micromonospora sp. MW-13]
MYGSTDPTDPEGARRRQDFPAGEPAWLTDRPEPRSAYLFGDEPDQPGDRRAADPHRAEPVHRPWAPPPTARWERPGDEPWREEPTGRRQPAGGPRRPAGEPWRPDAEPWRDEPTGRRYDQPTGPWHGQPTGPWQDEPAGRWHDQPTGPWHGQPADGAGEAERTRIVPVVGRAASAADGPRAGRTAYREDRAGDAPTGGEGRHRPARRLPRPLLIGGAAAAATLVVSLGVGALPLPGGDDLRTDRAAADAPVAAPADPDAASGPGGAAATPSPGASTARPSATPSRTGKPTPGPSRSTAASRSNQRSTPATTSRSAAGMGASSQAQQVVDLVNAERAKAGCGALKINSKLTAAAQAHSQDQADHRKMSHDGSDGSDVGERLDRVGYSWRAYGENVAWNQQTPAAVMDAWMNSSGHRANILNCSFTQIGVGVASSNGPYWTQDFGTPR